MLLSCFRGFQAASTAGFSVIEQSSTNSDLYKLTKGLAQLSSVPRKEAEFHVAKQVSVKTNWGCVEQYPHREGEQNPEQNSEKLSGGRQG